MFFSNQKYCVITYEYSTKEIYKYLLSIVNFLTGIFHINDEDVFNINAFNLDDTKVTQFNNKENLNDILEDCFAYMQEQSFENIKNFIDIEIKIYLKKEPLFLFQNKNKIFYLNDKKIKLIDKINNNITKNYKILTKVISDSLSQYLTEKSAILLDIFLDNKIPLNKLIVEEKGSQRFLDLMPLSVDILSSKLSLAYQEKSLLEKEIIEKINKHFSLDIPNDNTYISEVTLDNGTDFLLPIGITIGENIFMFNVYSFIKDKLLSDKSIHLKYLKHSIFLDDTKDRGNSKKIEEFKNQVSDKDLISILKILKNNIYTYEESFCNLNNDIKINFFHTGYKVESQYLDQNQIFIPYYEQYTSALFGIHNNTDARPHSGDNQKGLKSWINSNNEEQNTATDKVTTKAEKVVHLLPDLAFYFKERFFEDLLEILLHELAHENPTLELEIFSNKILFIDKNNDFTDPLDLKAHHGNNGQEFDFIVTYKKNDIQYTMVLEAKTKLSKFIIYDQAAKIENYIKYDDLQLFNGYALVGFNCDEDVNSTMAYFIDKLPIQSELEHLAFKYPLSTVNKDMYCVASNDRDILKTNLLALFNL